MRDIRTLIPELSAWNDGKGIDAESWISAIGRYDHAIGYSTIFWPGFCVHNDCVFRYPIDAETYAHWMEAVGGDKTKVEALANHQHIVDLFPNSVFQPSDEVVLYLGSILREMWSSKLRSDFPTREFVVEFPYGEAAGVTNCEITFYQHTHKTGHC